MAQVVRKIDAISTQNHDYDFSQILLSLTGNVGGVLNRTGTDFDLTGTTLSVGTAAIKCTRTTGVAPFASQDFLCIFYSTVDETVDTSAGNKIYIEINDSLIQDSALIADPETSNDFALGLNIGSIKSTPAYPSHTSYIPLYEIDGGGVVADVRNKTGIDVAELDLSTYTRNISATAITTGTITSTGLATFDSLTVTTAPNFPAGTQIDGISPAVIGSDAEAIVGTDDTKAISIKESHDLHGYSIVGGTDLTLFTSPDSDLVSGISTPTLFKEVEIDAAGTYRVNFDIRNSGTSNTSHGRIYVNGVAVGFDNINNSFSGTVSNSDGSNAREDITLAAGDLLQIYGWNIDGNGFFLESFVMRYSLHVNFLDKIT